MKIAQEITIGVMTIRGEVQISLGIEALIGSKKERKTSTSQEIRSEVQTADIIGLMGGGHVNVTKKRDMPGTAGIEKTMNDLRKGINIIIDVEIYELQLL